MSEKEEKDVQQLAGLSAEDLDYAARLCKMEGEKLERSGKKEKSAEHFERAYRFADVAASCGSAEGLCIIAELIQGEKVSAAKAVEDPVSEAVQLWEQAAEKGKARGLLNIGLLYVHRPIPGGGKNYGSVPFDPETALVYMQKAADAGDMKAPRNIGLCYREGKYVPKDEAKAFQYFEEAMNRGDSSGKLFCAEDLLVGNGVQQDVERAIRLYEELFEEAGHDITTSAYALGCIYRDGKYVPRDKAKAAEYFASVVKTADIHTQDLKKAAEEYLKEEP